MQVGVSAGDRALAAPDSLDIRRDHESINISLALTLCVLHGTYSPYNSCAMVEGERDAGFWILVVIAAVTVVCAAYTLLAVTGAVGDTAITADGEQPEITLDAPPASPRSGTATEGRTAVEEKRASDAAARVGLITAMGDSTMLGAVDALQREMPNLALLDAQGSRQPQAAIDLLRQYRADGHLGEVVIVHVGNNGPFTARDFDEMMKVLSGVRTVLVVNLTVPPNVEDPVAVPNDAVLLDGARRYPNAVLVDWNSASAGRPGYLWDGVHLTIRGARAYAHLIASHLGDPEEPVDLPGPRKRFSWGRGGLSGVCVGPPDWCLSVARQ